MRSWTVKINQKRYFNKRFDDHPKIKMARDKIINFDEDNSYNWFFHNSTI